MDVNGSGPGGAPTLPTVEAVDRMDAILSQVHQAAVAFLRAVTVARDVPSKGEARSLSLAAVLMTGHMLGRVPKEAHGFLVRFGHRRHLECAIDGVVEPGWHVAVMRLAVLLVWDPLKMALDGLPKGDDVTDMHRALMGRKRLKSAQVFRKALEAGIGMLEFELAVILVRLRREALFLRENHARVRRLIQRTEGLPKDPPKELILIARQDLLIRPDSNHEFRLDSPSRSEVILALAKAYPLEVSQVELDQQLTVGSRAIIYRLRKDAAFRAFLCGAELISSSKKGYRLAIPTRVRT